MGNPVDDLRQRIGSSLRHILAGNAEPRSRVVEGGLFGPESATWEVHGDASMLVGGIRALLLQTMHPPTMAGVADHSSYQTDPLGRLRRTGDFVGTTTYGSIEDAERAIETVRRIHHRIKGITPDGRPYRADDPHLLEWVHITEVDSFLEAKRRYGAPRLAAHRGDDYVAEMALIGGRLGVIDPPTTVDELRAALDSYRPELATGKQSRQAQWFLTFPPLPARMKAPYAVLFAGAVSSLPGWARRQLSVPRLPLAEALTVRPAAASLTRLLSWGLASQQRQEA